MIFFTTFAPSNNNPLVRLAQKRFGRGERVAYPDRTSFV